MRRKERGHFNRFFFFLFFQSCFIVLTFICTRVPIKRVLATLWVLKYFYDHIVILYINLYKFFFTEEISFLYCIRCFDRTSPFVWIRFRRITKFLPSWIFFTRGYTIFEIWYNNFFNDTIAKMFSLNVYLRLLFYTEKDINGGIKATI